MLSTKLTFFKSTFFTASASLMIVSAMKFDQLRRCERGQPIDEQLASALELSHRDEVQAVVDFETITAFPGAALCK